MNNLRTPLAKMDTDTLGFLCIAALLLVAGIGWYFGYVQPREEFLLAVTDCTNQAPPNTDPQAAWSQCVTVVQAQL